MRNSFLRAGVVNVVADSFVYLRIPQRNIVATIQGNVKPKAEIIVGGHIDSYSSDFLHAPGADDNASGTAAAIEMARVLTQLKYTPSVTIRFIGFAAEEAGLKGSYIYALKAQEQQRDIKMMFNYDMIGYRNQASNDRECYVVWYPGSEPHSNLYATIAEKYTSLTPVFTDRYQGSSDSWSFYQRGYNTMFVIETDFNPYYHSRSDSLSKLDIPYTCEIIKAGLASLLLLDQIPSAPTGLTAQSITGGIKLLWQCHSALDVCGYNVYRKSALDTGFVKINAQLCTDTVWNDSPLPAGNYRYRVCAVDLVSLESPFSDSVQASPVVGVGTVVSNPKEFKLEQNYPNPFNPKTSISFEMKHPSFVSMKVYDVFGNEVATLVNEHRGAGHHQVEWYAGELASGIYFYQMKTPEFTATKKLILMK